MEKLRHEIAQVNCFFLFLFCLRLESRPENGKLAVHVSCLNMVASVVYIQILNKLP